MDSLPSNFFHLPSGVQVDILSRLSLHELHAVSQAVPAAYAAGILGIINARKTFNMRAAAVARVLAGMHRGETVANALQRTVFAEMGLRHQGRALVEAMRDLALHLHQAGRPMPSLYTGSCTATYDDISALNEGFAADFNLALNNVQLP